MIDPARAVETLRDLGIELFTGVPDSLLKHFCAYVMDELPRDQHVIAANEGAAVGIAIGHHLRTGEPALVYLQNSGFGNAVNPLVSLADPDVYAVPMLLLVGWRGQPGVDDEPQHVKQGRVMTDVLDALELPWSVLPRDDAGAAACLEEAVEAARAVPGPSVVLVERGTFADAPRTEGDPDATGDAPLPGREEALIALADTIGDHAIQVSTTGMLSRELFEHRERRDGGGERDFLTVGGMGHCCSIALGVALREPEREVWCLDGDGALLMHLGTLAVIGDHAPANFFHVVFNNGVHDSVGGQPTSIGAVDVPAVAEALGYRSAMSAPDLRSLPPAVLRMRQRGGPALLELPVAAGSRPDLGRPTRTPVAAKRAFMSAVGTVAVDR